MGRKGGAKGKAHSSGLVDDVDAADRAKKSDTAVFGRPKKPKKGRNRYESSSDEDTAPLTAANKPATKVPEEVDSALEITQTRSQKRKQKKDRKALGGKSRTYGSDDDEVLTLAAMAKGICSPDDKSKEDEPDLKLRETEGKKTNPEQASLGTVGFAALMGAATDEDESEVNSAGEVEVDTSTSTFSILRDSSGDGTKFAALVDVSDDDESGTHADTVPDAKPASDPGPQLKEKCEISNADDEPVLLIKKKKKKKVDLAILTGTDEETGASHLLIAEIIDCNRHPMVDKLMVCSIDWGGDRPARVVSGAPNVKTGLKVIFCRVGVKVPSTGEVLTSRSFKGVMSEGLIMSAAEMGWMEKAVGVVECPRKSVVGKPAPKDPPPDISMADPAAKTKKKDKDKKFKKDKKDNSSRRSGPATGDTTFGQKKNDADPDPTEPEAAQEGIVPRPTIEGDQKKKKPPEICTLAKSKDDDDLDALFAELGIESNLDEGRGESKAARKRREKKEREAEAVLNSSNTDTRDGNSERVPTQNTLDDSTSGSEVGIWEKQLEELEVKQSRGDQLTDAEKNKLKKLKKRAKEKEKKENRTADLSKGPKVSAAVLKMQENLRLRDEAAAALAAAAAEEEARIKAEEEAEAQKKAEEDAKKAAKKEKERLKKEQLRAEGKLLSAKQKEEQKRLEVMRAQLLAKSNASGVTDHVPMKRSISDDKKKKKALAEKRRLEAEAARQAAETVTTSAPEHATKTAGLENFLIAEESDDAEDDWDAVDNLDDLVKISSKVQMNHEVHEEGDQTAQLHSQEEPDGKHEKMVGAVTQNGQMVSSAPIDEKMEPKSQAISSIGRPTSRQMSLDLDIDSGDESKGSSNASLDSDLSDESEYSSDISSSEYSSTGEDSDSDEDHELRIRIAAARAARLERFEVEKNNRSKDRLRCPIICIMGHVDTGKTKILDNIRKTNVQDAEAGGITQQIGATFVPDSSLKDRTYALNKGDFDIKVPGILVIDTPGHESFTNLRSRGSSLCDMAILVVDIMHGLEPQTLESLNMLRMRKTPFIIALNKIDRMYDWKAQTNAAARDSLAAQKQHSKSEFEDRARKIMLEFAKEGLNAALYWDNPDVRTFINVVPTSAITGEGIPDLLHTLVSLTQTRLNVQLQFFNAVQCTVLEVKMIEGLGTTMDVILINGTLKEGQTIVIAGLEGAIVTNVRALLTPQPLREIRVKANYQHHKEISAAMGIKILAQGLEKAVAGTSLLVQDPEDDLDELKEEVLSDMKNVLARVDKSGEGVYVQASTLGSLEALLEFLKSPAVSIPVAGIAIGPVNKRDVMGASVMHERKCPEYATILAFDVKVTDEAYKMAVELNVKIMTADIIYHLFDQFTDFLEKIKQKKREEAAERVSFPCVLKIMPNCIFNKRDPIVVGVDVLKGIARVGTQLCIPTQGFIDIGKIASMELNHKQVEKALPGQSVAMKIQAVSSAESSRLYGRHFDHKDELVSRITRESIDMLKDNFRDELTKDDWRLVVELKKKFEIFYGEPM